MKKKQNLLVAVIRDRRDLKLLLVDKIYRIPVAYLPKRDFTYIAFYQPANFGRRGKRIEYYARVLKKEIVPRVVILPRERSHPRADDLYAKFTVATPRKLSSPIRNVIPRRVTFGYTDTKTLLASKDILELYHVPKTEQIIAGRLRHLGVEVNREYTVSGGGKRVRIDIAIITDEKKIAIECDNEKAHSSKIQKEKDKAKDYFLEKLGWQVVRLSESDILNHLEKSVNLVLKTLN